MVSSRIFLVFCLICLASVRSSPIGIDVLENRDIIFPRRSELVKRRANNDVSELNHQKVSLASFIENIETGILQTALSVEPLASSDGHVEVENVSTSTTTSPHPIEIRSTKEDADVPVESSTAYVVLQTSEKVSAIESVPSHVVIDRVSVFKAPEVGSGLFPTFLVQESNVSSVDDSTETNPEVDEEGSTIASDSDSSECDEDSKSSESEDSSEEKSSKVKCSSTTIPEKESSSTHSPPSTSSTKTLTVDEKKIVEKELKEKIGEIEAEPVIFTARV